MDYRHLQALAAVLEHGGFERAAEHLSITQSAVSQRIRKLESEVGHTLLVRATPPALTPRGELVLRHFQQVALLRHDLREQLGASEDGWHRLPIGVNADSLATWLPDALAPLQSDPRLLLDIQVTDQDLTHELLRGGEVIGCISSSAQAISGCNCFGLGIMVYRCLVAPQFLQRYFPGGVEREGMAEAPCVEFGAADELQRRFLRQEFQLEYRNPRHRIPAPDSFLDFIARGWAWGMVPDLQSADWLARGDVVELLPGHTVQVPLYWHIWNLQTRLYRELTSHLRQAAERALAPLPE